MSLLLLVCFFSSLVLNRRTRTGTRHLYVTAPKRNQMGLSWRFLSVWFLSERLKKINISFVRSFVRLFVCFDPMYNSTPKFWFSLKTFLTLLGWKMMWYLSLYVSFPRSRNMFNFEYYIQCNMTGRMYKDVLYYDLLLCNNGILNWRKRFLKCMLSFVCAKVC